MECAAKVKKRNNSLCNFTFFINTYIFITEQTIKFMGKTPAKDKTLTSLKLEPNDFDEFRVLCVRTKFSLSKLVDRAMHYYNNDEEFRKIMHNYKHEITGSVK